MLGLFLDADIFLCSHKSVVWFVSYFYPQEAEAFALYHKALDLQKHDKFEDSAKAYHELLKTPLLKEVKYHTAYRPRHYSYTEAQHINA